MNARLTSISKSLNELYKLPKSQAALPVNVAKVQLLESEQQDLLNGGKVKAAGRPAGAAAAPGAGATSDDPVGSLQNNERCN